MQTRGLSAGDVRCRQILCRRAGRCRRFGTASTRDLGAAVALGVANVSEAAAARLARAERSFDHQKRQRDAWSFWSANERSARASRAAATNLSRNIGHTHHCLPTLPFPTTWEKLCIKAGWLAPP